MVLTHVNYLHAIGNSLKRSFHNIFRRANESDNRAICVIARIDIQQFNIWDSLNRISYFFIFALSRPSEKFGTHSIIFVTSFHIPRLLGPLKEISYFHRLANVDKIS